MQGLQQPPGLQRPPVEGESHESQRQRAQEAAARELARAAAARAAAAAAAAVADESEVKRLNLLPRAVMAFRRPVGIEGWKDARAMEASSAQMLRSTAAGTYGMVHALRPQGRDWQAYQAVRPRAHVDVGRFDKLGPFPNEVLEIQIGTANSCVGAIMSNKKDLTSVIMEAVAAMEAGAAGGAGGKFSFEPELARLDFANHKEDCLLGTRVSVEDMADMLDALAEAEYGRLCSISRWCGRSSMI